MVIHDQYDSEIQHEFALLKTGKANYAVLSQLSIIFEIPDGIKLTIQEFTRGVVAFMYVTSGREKKSCVVYNRGEILVSTILYEILRVFLYDS